MVELSICIPTYNRREYIQETINSILFQLNDDTKKTVEIVISDNCSTDGTEELIKDYIRANEDVNFTYSKSCENVGADNNYIRVISLASGKYCWFMGSDDMLAEGSLDVVLDMIREGHTIYLSNRFNSKDGDMTETHIQKFISDEIEENTIFTFCNIKDWDYYINRCETLGALFSYLSSIIFRRDEWMTVDCYGAFIGTAYVHVAILLMMLRNEHATLKYVVRPLVINRLGNDSFMTTRYDRLMIDIKGYMQLSELFDDEPIIKKDIRMLLKKEHPSINWRVLLGVNKKKYGFLKNELKAIGYDELEIFWFDILRMLKFVNIGMIVIQKMMLRKTRDSKE